MQEEKEKFNHAETLLSEGGKSQAAQIFLEIFNSSSDIVMRINCGLELNRSLDIVNNTNQLISITSETISLANKLVEKDIKALALCYMALLLIQSRISKIDRKTRLKLSPEWFEFSLEREKLEYERIDKELVNLEDEVKQVLKEAESIANETKDTSLKSAVYSMIGQSYGYLSFEFRYKKIGKNWLQQKLVKKNLEYLLYNREDRENLRKLHKQSDKFFLQAIEISKFSKNPTDGALAFYNYANQLRTMNRNHQARKCLKESKKIAVTLHDNTLLRNIKILDDRIKSPELPERTF